MDDYNEERVKKTNKEVDDDFEDMDMDEFDDMELEMDD